MPPAGIDTGFGIYVHWPFCVSKCPYCDFNSHVAEGAVEHGRWRRAYLTELDHHVARTAGRRVTSVFFGGGTPSLMEPVTAAAVIEAIKARWPVASDVEITLEANPSSVEAARFRAFAEAGVNRMSIGVQAFDDTALAFLGRAHDAQQAEAAIAAAAGAVPRFSFDLIYARPGQTVAAWQKELDHALAFAPEHLSVYQLTIEKGTAFHKPGVPAAPEDRAVELWEATQERLTGAGLPAYEISNHARPGAECRHNQTYWRAGPYVGIGPGAHGRLPPGDGSDAWTGTRTLPGPLAWLAAVEARGHGIITAETLSPEERRDEAAMMGLRLGEGLRPDTFRAATGMELDAAFDSAKLAGLIDGGFLTMDKAGLRCTAEGLVRLDSVLGLLLV